MIKVLVNGETHEFARDLELSVLLSELDLPDTRIAVELNKTVIRKSAWSETRVSENDVIEIVQFVGGG